MSEALDGAISLTYRQDEKLHGLSYLKTCHCKRYRER